MKHLRHSVAAAPLLFAIALCSCTTAPTEGRYVVFVNEVMTASAQLPASDAPKRSEQVLRAVTVWRGGSGRNGGDADRGTDNASGGISGGD